MSITERVEGKSDQQLALMDLQDVLHTLRKNKVGETNTQVSYALEVFDKAIITLKEKI